MIAIDLHVKRQTDASLAAWHRLLLLTNCSRLLLDGQFILRVQDWNKQIDRLLFVCIRSVSFLAEATFLGFLWRRKIFKEDWSWRSVFLLLALLFLWIAFLSLIFSLFWVWLRLCSPCGVTPSLTRRNCWDGLSSWRLVLCQQVVKSLFKVFEVHNGARLWLCILKLLCFLHLQDFHGRVAHLLGRIFLTFALFAFFLSLSRFIGGERVVDKNIEHFVAFTSSRDASCI